MLPRGVGQGPFVALIHCVLFLGTADHQLWILVCFYVYRRSGLKPDPFLLVVLTFQPSQNRTAAPGEKAFAEQNYKIGERRIQVLHSIWGFRLYHTTGDMTLRVLKLLDGESHSLEALACPAFRSVLPPKWISFLNLWTATPLKGISLSLFFFPYIPYTVQSSQATRCCPVSHIHVHVSVGGEWRGNWLWVLQCMFFILKKAISNLTCPKLSCSCFCPTTYYCHPYLRKWQFCNAQAKGEKNQKTK